jgi:hypothetical protein
MSYSKNSQSQDDVQRITDFNHFVIFDVRVSACLSKLTVLMHIGVDVLMRIDADQHV